jgi:hypothetical protein
MLLVKWMTSIEKIAEHIDDQIWRGLFWTGQLVILTGRIRRLEEMIDQAYHPAA